ncbi:MAG: Crp/Fnr family transcriptional regulator [Bacteroidota bacterium]
MYNQIDQYIFNCITLNESELNFFHSILRFKKVKRKTLLLTMGEVCNFEAFIIKGCMRIYHIDENDQEVVLHFGTENWWVSDLASYTQNTPTQLNIQALEDCELFIIEKQDKEKLFETVPQFERMFRLMIQKTHAALQQRFLNTLSKDAETRYKTFLLTYPEIPQRVAQHHIASFLGISAEFLSKIRTKMAKRHS